MLSLWIDPLEEGVLPLIEVDLVPSGVGAGHFLGIKGARRQGAIISEHCKSQVEKGGGE